MEKIQKSGNESPISILDELEDLPKIEFTATAYAVIENEQKLDVLIKRTGPTDVDVRFRCLHSLIHIHMNENAIIQINTLHHLFFIINLSNSIFNSLITTFFFFFFTKFFKEHVFLKTTRID